MVFWGFGVSVKIRVRIRTRIITVASAEAVHIITMLQFILMVSDVQQSIIQRNAPMSLL